MSLRSAVCGWLNSIWMLSDLPGMTAARKKRHHPPRWAFSIVVRRQTRIAMPLDQKCSSCAWMSNCETVEHLTPKWRVQRKWSDKGGGAETAASLSTDTSETFFFLKTSCEALQLLNASTFVFSVQRNQVLNYMKVLHSVQWIPSFQGKYYWSSEKERKITIPSHISKKKWTKRAEILLNVIIIQC